jgi:hypothetical protein
MVILQNSDEKRAARTPLGRTFARATRVTDSGMSRM